MKAYIVINEHQYKSVVGATHTQGFRPSLIIDDIPSKDAHGNCVNGMLVLTISDETPISIDLDNYQTTVSLGSADKSNKVLFEYIIKE